MSDDAMGCDAERVEPPEPLLWVTKEGKSIRLKDMSDSHLDNAIKMCERFQLERPDVRLRGHRISTWLRELKEEKDSRYEG